MILRYAMQKIKRRDRKYVPEDRRVQTAGLRQKQGFLSTVSSDLKGLLPPVN